MTADLRARIERAVGMHLRPGPECTPHPDEIAIVESVMAEISATCEYLMAQAEQYQARAHAAEKTLAEHGLGRLK